MLSYTYTVLYKVESNDFDYRSCTVGKRTFLTWLEFECSDIRLWTLLSFIHVHSTLVWSQTNRNIFTIVFLIIQLPNKTQ